VHFQKKFWAGKLVLTASFGLAALCCTAQQMRADSLRDLLHHYQGEDSGRVLLLISLVKTLVYTNPDSMVYYADEALSESEKIKWRQGIARSLQLKGVAYSYGMNDQVSALNYYHQALDANNNPKNPVLEFNTIANIAIIFYNMKQYDEALAYYRRSLVLLHQMTGRTGEEQLFLNIGNVYYDKNLFDTATYYFNQSLQLAEARHNTLITIGALNALGTAAIRSGTYDSAENFVRESLDLSNQTRNMLTKAVSLVNMALIKFHTHRLDSAERYGREALAVAEQANSMQFRREAYDVLSQTYAELGRYQDAYNAGKHYNILNDSLLSDESKQQITRLDLQYDFDKKAALTKAAADKNQALAMGEINRQKLIRNGSIAVAGILIFSAIFGIVLYKRRKDILQKKKEAEFNAQVADTEMKALRAQMNPHFIYNSLNSINDYIDRHDTAKATTYTTKFAKLMRMILENSEKKEVPLADDLKALELYMQLENMRLRQKFVYEIIVDDDIDAENTLIPPLILQPFVENSIWHGLSKKEGEGKILIHIKKEGDMINCIVLDNGIGRQEAAKTEKNTNVLYKKPLGMKITKERIDILNRLKKSKAAINLLDLEGGTRIEVRLPEEIIF